MRPFRISIPRVAYRLTRCATTITPQVPREVALARWNTKEGTAAGEKGGLLGKGMNFASSLGFGATGGGSSRSSMNVQTSAADVSWDLCDRMDYLVQYSVPSNWLMAEQVRENNVTIQLTPPRVAGEEGKATSPSVHGISISCFAYRRKVVEPNCEKLLHTFLHRFNASVRNSLEIISEASVQPTSAVVPPTAADHTSSSEEEERLTHKLAQQLQCAVAEITFTPAPGQPLAHGLCRAFYNSNGRYHYIVVVAVPDDEYDTSLDLIIHALLSVVEGRVEAAAKRL
ncbi:hypothetical protein AGDE_01260 [Angomonas deanei]|uniref:Uncharacterized protein n=1 Tax=Angomonas deanei TaxID=59799 RepID=A0A7G2C6D9_9TRYP|nr:hypothetical protein AGDE_01260 [Angomonas deanei]CAD2215129.1 hypothetical protein, conserved [Angomonas deanei]|eukprot:EPY42663.1 hypothetical protein AGDE_01260 [Angomonas deanei]